LIALWEDERIPALRLTFIDSATDQIVQRRYRFARAPMADEYGPSLPPVMEGSKLIAWPIFDGRLGKRGPWLRLTALHINVDPLTKK
jgi:hypothetical protein